MVAAISERQISVGGFSPRRDLPCVPGASALRKQSENALRSALQHCTSCVRSGELTTCDERYLERVLELRRLPMPHQNLIEKAHHAQRRAGVILLDAP